MSGIFASKAEAEAFAATVLGFSCRLGSHGSPCGWIGPDGLAAWPMPIGFGVRAWCSCPCHGRPAQLSLGIDEKSR